MLVENWQLLRVERTRDAGSLEGAWLDLAGCAMEPAGLNRPELLGPIVRHSPDAEIHAVFAQSRLLLAMAARSRGRVLPVAVALTGPLSSGTIPHADSHAGEAALAALQRQIGRPVLFSGIPAAGPFWDALQRASGRFAVLDRWERAALRPDGTYQSWFEANFDKKRRKEFRRLRSRLADAGELQSRALAPGEDVRPWVHEFLDLEAAGWKGSRGTAIRQQPGLAEALVEAAARLQASGHLRFWKLTLNGRPIAALFAIVEGGQAWLGKIAYDEVFSRSSPGVLVVLDATERLFEEPQIRLIDTCAIPSHPMIDSIWRDRLPMADVLTAGPGTGELRFRLSVAAEILRRRLRSRVRDAYYWLRGWHRS